MVYSIWTYKEVYLSNTSEENARTPYKHLYKTSVIQSPLTTGRDMFVRFRSNLA
jgi:hypothetical protein